MSSLFLDGKTDIRTIQRPIPREKAYFGSIPQLGIQVGFYLDNDRQLSDLSQLSSAKRVRLNIKFASLPPQEEPSIQDSEVIESRWKRHVRDLVFHRSHSVPRLERVDTVDKIDWEAAIDCKPFVYKYGDDDDDDEEEEDGVGENNWVERDEKVPYTSLETMMIRLDEAEKLLKAINCGEDYADPDFDLDLNSRYDLLPQQRITNVVQELDGLFDASIMAIDLALVKGKKWFRQVIEQTAPIFNEVWKDGIFSQEKCLNLLEQLHTLLESTCASGDRQSSLEVPNVPDRPKAKNRYSHTPEFRKEMVKLGFSIIRQYPWMNNISEITRLAKTKDKRFEQQYLKRWTREVFGVSFEEEKGKYGTKFLQEHGGKAIAAHVDDTPASKKNAKRGKDRKGGKPKRRIQYVSNDTLDLVTLSSNSPSSNEVISSEQLEKRMLVFLDSENLPRTTTHEELKKIANNDPGFEDRCRLALGASKSRKKPQS